MKKLTLIAALAAMTATPAMAQVSSPTVQFNAEVAVVCTVVNLDPFINFGIITSNGAASTQSDTGIDVFCNQPSTVTFTSLNGGLQLNSSAITPTNETTWDASGNPGFSAGLDYSATVPSFGGIAANTALLDATVPEMIATVPALNQTGITIDYDTVTSSNPLIGGSYTDVLTVSLSPNGV